MSNEQLVAIIPANDESLSNMKTLNMSNDQYTAEQTVDAKMMAKAFVHQTVTSEHSTKILDEALQSTSLQEQSVDDPSHAIDETPLFDEHLLSKAKQVFPIMFTSQVSSMTFMILMKTEMMKSLTQNQIVGIDVDDTQNLDYL